ncbi:hypothetical protein [Planktotalea sp.]|uniref:hypothetical protein n=1 Tax=Planktotalea sp. TaxID=2029877 RepID=UPI003F6BF201
MNMNTIINMVIRRVMSIAINKGINAGVDQIAKRKGRNSDGPQQSADIQQDKQRMRQTARLGRRITKL